MRVIAGRFGGRTLFAPPGRGTRPTADRVREALFSILGDLEERRVLDLYAGTGALGIEALSRGAATATFVESERAPLAALRRNVDALGLGAQVKVVPLRVDRALASFRDESVFDQVFVDPPYDRVSSFVAAWGIATQRGLDIVAPGGCLVLEHAAATDPPALDGLGFREDRRYGDSKLSFYEKPTEH